MSMIIYAYEHPSYAPVAPLSGWSDSKIINTNRTPSVQCGERFLLLFRNSFIIGFVIFIAVLQSARLLQYTSFLTLMINLRIAPIKQMRQLI